MGFAIYFRSTEAISPALQREVNAANHEQTQGRSWLSCEPPYVHDEDGYLSGASKPNFAPGASDVASAAKEGLPDGKVTDLLDVLCALSSQFDIDWEISHDHSDGPLGYIRQGFCDEEVRTQCECFDDVTKNILDELDPDDFE